YVYKSQVLAEELGTPAENLHKFLWEWTAGPHAGVLAEGRGVPLELGFFALGAGDVVLVDEAGMAGTLNLDRLVSIAARRGAVVRLLGDYRQLGAVESGGALRLVARECGAVELSTLYRFADAAEAQATLAIRVGDTSGLDFYQRHDRVRHGSRQSMTEQAYAGWRADMLAGRTALMAAASNADVAALCARARADRVAVGQVEPGGVRL
ncbi:AAA family ATPase, partial [Actinocrinis puniceicyclus]